jgi:hypothetical protein
MDFWAALPRFLRRWLNRPRIALILHAISRSPEARAARVWPMTWRQSWAKAEIINASDYARAWYPPDDLWQLRAAETTPRMTRDQFWGAEP